VVGTGSALAAMGLDIGERTWMSLAQVDVEVLVTGRVEALPATTEATALLVDLPSLSAALFARYGLVREPQEWWVATRPDEHPEAAAAATALDRLDVRDRVAEAARGGRDPYGAGTRVALFAAAAGAVLIAALGLLVGVRTTARRRAGEFAVLRALGAGPRLLARALVAEQAFVAGLGVLAGLVVGVGVATAVVPLVVLTPAAQRPVPAPLLAVDWLPMGASAVGLCLLTMALSALVAGALRRQLVATGVRAGELP
jgi:predicted lysophospholipase L1 biosynthesis ABC-type transport system permease subunit